MKERRVIVIALAPAAPPCFPTAAMWVEFLRTAADCQRVGSRGAGPLDLRTPEPAFNYRWDFCRPCAAKYALSMQKLGKCKPDYLRDLAPTPTAEHAK